MAYRYKKPHRIRKRKSVLRSLFLRLAILIFAAIGGISYFLFFSGIFQIKKIIITGEGKASKAAIESLVAGKNIFLIDIPKIKKDISDDFLQIAGTQIHRVFPNSLNISVEERLPAARWCDEIKCFLVDGDGMIFEEAPPETDLVKILGAKDLLNKERISQILGIQAKLKNDLGVTTTQAFIAAGERLNIQTAEEWEIYFNLNGDLNWQVQELALVLEKQISPARRNNLEYIDLRFSRVFYK